MAKALPRGIRNNNPGNIDRGDPWQGLAEPDQMTPEQAAEPRFAVFAAPVWGIRAISRVLITYQDKHGLDTVAEVIGRWAPPNENDTDSYIDQVRRRLGVAVGGEINVHEYDTMRELVLSIIRHENGPGPLAGGRWYDDATIDEGLRLAGVKPPQPPVRKERDIVATGTATVISAGAAAASAGKAIVDAIQPEAVEPAVRTAQAIAPWLPTWGPVLVGGVVASLLVIALVKQLRDRSNGVR